MPVEPPIYGELLGQIRALSDQVLHLTNELVRARKELAQVHAVPAPARNSPSKWARALATQALADLAARQALLLSGDVAVKVCHQLHFLQMAAEKVSKAYRCHGGEEPARLQRSHAYAGKVLPIIARQRFRSDVSRDADLKKLRDLAREIDLLAPSVRDDGRRPDNCEYPWEDTHGNLLIPAECEFGKLAGLDLFPMGTTLLKVIQVAAEELAAGAYGPDLL